MGAYSKSLRTKLVFVGSVVLMGCGESHDGLAVRPNWVPETWSLASDDDARALEAKIELARGTCVHVLEEHSPRSASATEEDHAVRAALYLGKLRPNDDESLNALISNLRLRSLIVRAPQPLDSYVSAEAIVRIGGREAAEAIHRRLRRELDHEELLLCAHILYRIDERNAALARLVDARATSSDEVFVLNIDRLVELLSTHDFPANHRHWPGVPNGRRPREERMISTQISSLSDIPHE